MARRALLLILAICMVMPSPAVAGETGPPLPAEGTRIEIAVVPEAMARDLAASGPTVAELRDLNREAHETLEGEEDDRPWWRKLFSWRSWKEKLDFRKTATNARRWFALRGGDVRSHEHVVNLILMYSASHLSETLLGGAAASWAGDPANTAHWFLKAAVTAAGLTIVVPGLDPICIGLGYLYWRFPRAMHVALTPPRFLVVRVVYPAAKYTGVWALLKRVGGWLVASEQGVKFLHRVLQSDTTGIYRWSVGEGRYDVTVLDAGGVHPLARLELRESGEGGLELERARLWTDAPLNRAHLQKALQPFGYDVRSAVFEASDALRAGKAERLAKRVYVRDIQDEGDSTVVGFARPAVRVGSHRRFRPWPFLLAAAETCARALGAPSPPLLPPGPR